MTPVQICFVLAGVLCFWAAGRYAFVVFPIQWRDMKRRHLNGLATTRRHFFRLCLSIATLIVSFLGAMVERVFEHFGLPTLANPDLIVGICAVSAGMGGIGIAENLVALYRQRVD